MTYQIAIFVDGKEIDRSPQIPDDLDAKKTFYMAVGVRATTAAIDAIEDSKYDFSPDEVESWFADIEIAEAAGVTEVAIGEHVYKLVEFNEAAPTPVIDQIKAELFIEKQALVNQYLSENQN